MDISNWTYRAPEEDKHCMRALILGCTLIAAAAVANAQNPPIQLVQPQGPGAPPPVITLQDALDRAQRLDLAYQSAVTDAQVAREDRVQAKAALLPAVSNLTEYLGTQ